MTHRFYNRPLAKEYFKYCPRCAKVTLHFKEQVNDKIQYTCQECYFKWEISL